MNDSYQHINTFIQNLSNTIYKENIDFIHSFIPNIINQYIENNREIIESNILAGLSKQPQFNSDTLFHVPFSKNNSYVFTFPDINDVKLDTNANLARNNKANLGSNIEHHVHEIMKERINNLFKEIDDEIYTYIDVKIKPRLNNMLMKLFNSEDIHKQFTYDIVNKILKNCFHRNVSNTTLVEFLLSSMQSNVDISTSEDMSNNMSTLIHTNGLITRDANILVEDNGIPINL